MSLLCLHRDEEVCGGGSDVSDLEYEISGRRSTLLVPCARVLGYSGCRARCHCLIADPCFCCGCLVRRLLALHVDTGVVAGNAFGFWGWTRMTAGQDSDEADSCDSGHSQGAKSKFAGLHIRVFPSGLIISSAEDRTDIGPNPKGSGPG